MLKIRRSRDRLLFNMGIPIPGNYGLYIETGPMYQGQGQVVSSQIVCKFSYFDEHIRLSRVEIFYNDTLVVNRQ